jgi:hypothetical protein
MNVRIAQLFCFNAGAWYGDELEMNQYTIKLWLVTKSMDLLEQNIAFCRARHFIHNQIENSIFMNSNDPKCSEFVRLGLNITTLPGDPADQLVGIMLFHKLNSIMEDRIRLLEIEISTGDAVVYLHGEDETAEFLERPDWWATSDLVHSDYAAPDSNNVVAIPQSTVWRDLDLAWPDDPNGDDSGNVVVFADFKSNDAKE